MGSRSPEHISTVEEEEEKDRVSGKGTWKHAAFHVATTIATPAAYAPLPFALASLGWPLVFWGYWSIASFQQIASLGNNIAIQIAAGSSLKAVYKHYHSDGKLTLQHFIIFFGIFELLLSQLPDIHSLRWVNALCTFSIIGFAGTTIGVTVYNEYGKRTRKEEYVQKYISSLHRDCFELLAVGFLRILGFRITSPFQNRLLLWQTYLQLFKFVDAFGVTILTPRIVYQIYCRPTYTYFEGSIESNKSTSRFRLRIQLIRLFYTSIYMTLVTLIAAAIPFFGDFVSICGANEFTPLDFVCPALAYLKAGNIAKNSKLGILMKLLNILIATWFSLVALLGCIGAVRSIVEDIKNYKFFYDM
ncbi:hypothetical protein KIW84_061586 [Lathyrus oleraceus]|uniref:Amino acid transporter transmembrane domain-containing protein n=1 Tax=Pisum sativum TaxID=3888 RepID=A0A9D5A2J1_PEA|nr:hypothetical protein KIW84_061586 [Pisum sativum]